MNEDPMKYLIPELKIDEWYPIDKSGIANVNNAKEAEWVFWRRLESSAIIARTLRLALRYPDLSKEYLDSLPKATMD